METVTQTTQKVPSLPDVLNESGDLKILQFRYTTILQSFPDGFSQTLEDLQEVLDPECICAILTGEPNAKLANKMMLDCLIAKIYCKEGLLDFCDNLEKISNAPNMAMVVSQLRTELQLAFQEEYSNNSNRPLVVTQKSVPEMKSWFVTQTSLSDHCKGLVKRHYAELCNSLPVDSQKSILKLRQYNRMLPQEAIEALASCSSEMVNQRIVDCLVISCSGNDEFFCFCDQMEKLVENPHCVESLRNDFLTAEVVIDNREIRPNTSSGDLVTDKLSQVRIQLHNKQNATINDEQSSENQNPTTPLGLHARKHLKQQIHYDQDRLEHDIKYQQPPLLPINYVERSDLLNKLATAIINAKKCSPDSNPTVTVSGTGGFGKTTLVQAICHHDLVKKHFTDGFMFVDIGPQYSDPAAQLHQLYHLLTGGKSLPRGNLAFVIEEIRKFTSTYFHKLLVLIDDVWEVSDARPVLQAFSSCKTILTSRITNICELVKSEEYITVDSMTHLEAATLLTTEIVDLKKLPETTMKLLENLAEDVQLWPLLLSLVRGLFKSSQRLYSHSFEQHIQYVQSKIQDKGLTALDKEHHNKAGIRNRAIKACVEASLDLLLQHEKDMFKAIILFTGIGSSVPVQVLYLLWKINEMEAKQFLEKLCTYGLIMPKKLLIPPYYNEQECTEVHASISAFVMRSLESDEVVKLSVEYYGTAAIIDALTNAFDQSFGQHPTKLSQEKFLLYWKTRLEHDVLVYYLRRINMTALIDPHRLNYIVKQIEKVFLQIPMMSQYGAELVSELETTAEESLKTLTKAPKLSQQLNQTAQQCLYENDSAKLFSTLEDYCDNYPVGKIAGRSAETCKKMIIYMNGLSYDSRFLVSHYQHLQMMTCKYHEITGSTIVLARVDLHLDLYKQVCSALESKSPSEMQAVNDYVKSGRFKEEEHFVNINQVIKIKKFAPQMQFEFVEHDH